MNPIDARPAMVKSIKTLLLIFIVLGLVAANFGPGVVATCDYAFRPHQIDCQGFSLRVPLNWKIKNGHCPNLYIERRRGPSFSSDESVGLLLVRQLNGTDVTRSEKEFESTYSVLWQVTETSLRDDLHVCRKAALREDPGWVSVNCWNAVRGIDFTFIGNETNLAEAQNLVH